MPLSIMIDSKSSQADGLGMDGRLFCAYQRAQYRELRERETQLLKIPFLVEGRIRVEKRLSPIA